MGLFNKTPKKTEQPEVLSHIFSENEILYRFPKDNFISGSILFVQPGQEAVLIKEGDQDGPYTNGRYTLNTNELPGINKFVSKLYGGENAFECYLYFINKSKPVTVFWGTPHPIMVRDGETAHEVRMMANGSMALTISNSLQFIERMNGQEYSFSTEDIADFLFEKFIERITSMLSGKFDELEQVGMPVKRIQGLTADISDTIKKRITDERIFDTYGLTLKEFSIFEIKMNAEDETALRVEQNKLASRRREADMRYYETRSQGSAEADVMWAKGKAEADVMKEKGDFYSKERMYDVLESAAQNESGIGSNSFIGAGVGLGVGLGVGGGFGGAMGSMMAGAFTPDNRRAPEQPTPPPQPTQPEAGEKCPSCNAINPKGVKFCHECGEKLGDKTQKCPVCSADNPIGVKFCHECGASFLPKKIKCPTCGVEVENPGKFCPECGGKLE